MIFDMFEKCEKCFEKCSFISNLLKTFKTSVYGSNHTKDTKLHFPIYKFSKQNYIFFKKHIFTETDGKQTKAWRIIMSCS